MGPARASQKKHGLAITAGVSTIIKLGSRRPPDHLLGFLPEQHQHLHSVIKQEVDLLCGKKWPEFGQSGKATTSLFTNSMWIASRRCSPLSIPGLPVSTL
jgi:hypothetical protein